MNKQERINSLTWKYFWTQKLEEITLTFCYLVTFAFSVTLLSFFGRVVERWQVSNYPSWGSSLACSQSQSIGCFFTYILVGMTYLFMVAIGILIIVLVGILVLRLIKILIDWVKRNWKKAERRARREVK